MVGSAGTPLSSCLWPNSCCTCSRPFMTVKIGNSALHQDACPSKNGCTQTSPERFFWLCRICSTELHLPLAVLRDEEEVQQPGVTMGQYCHHCSDEFSGHSGLHRLLSEYHTACSKLSPIVNLKTNCEPTVKCELDDQYCVQRKLCPEYLWEWGSRMNAGHM